MHACMHTCASTPSLICACMHTGMQAGTLQPLAHQHWTLHGPATLPSLLLYHTTTSSTAAAVITAAYKSNTVTVHRTRAHRHRAHLHIRMRPS